MEGKTINGYTLIKPLGKGGMAEVWYAENSLGKGAAVKILLEKFCHDDAVVARFKNEAQVMVQLDHPNIRQVYDFCYIDERPCILMEYLEGEDLKALMKCGRHFTDNELRRWWDQIADALNYTHGKGIVHRDIKPSNIFLDKNGNIKLLDFGIAKIKESISMTQTGAMMGTLMYMSPEQVLDSKHIGPKSDIYSLAVTFVHLLTGKAPYDTTTSNDYAIRKGIVEEPLDLSEVPTDWQGFLKPYLEKTEEKRPELKHFKSRRITNEDTIKVIDSDNIINRDKDEETILDKTHQTDDPTIIGEMDIITLDDDRRFVQIFSKKEWLFNRWIFVLGYIISVGIIGLFALPIEIEEEKLLILKILYTFSMILIVVVLYFLTRYFVNYIKRYNILKKSNYYIEAKKAAFIFITDGKFIGLLNKRTLNFAIPIEYEKLTWNENNQVYVGIKNGKRVLFNMMGKIISR